MVWHTALVGLLAAGAAIAIYAVVARQLVGQLESAIDQRALAASWNFQAALLERARQGGVDYVLDLPQAVADADGRFLVQLVDPSGHIVGQSENLARPLPIPATTLGLALAGQDSSTTLTIADERLQIYNTPLLMEGRVKAVLQVAAPLQPVEDELARLRLLLSAGVLGVTLLAAALGWFLATKAMRPVDRMTWSARVIGRSPDF